MAATSVSYSIGALGDCALTIELASKVGATTSARVRSLCDCLLAARLDGVRDIVPALRSVTVHYDPLVFAANGAAPLDAICAVLEPLLSQALEAELAAARRLEIPVCYGGEYGEDLETLAQAHNLSPATVVELHTAPVYFIGMLGPAPGFVYLGELNPKLHTPGRAMPRAGVPRGSVVIRGEHTGIDSLESPGESHLIGRTPLTLFDLGRSAPSLLEAGDQVHFVAIDSSAFARIEREGQWP